jgi:hypothetical protein
MFLRNIGIYQQVYTVAQLKRKHLNLHRGENLKSDTSKSMFRLTVSTGRSWKRGVGLEDVEGGGINVGQHET